jgi:hypothetical protein
MEMGGDPLFARTVVLSYGEKRFVITSVEMLTVPDSLRRAVASRLPAGLDLFLCATHTHSAPDSQMLNDRMTFAIPGIAAFRPRWLNWYADKIASGIKAALSSKPISSTDIVAIQQWQADLNRGRRKGADPDQTATLVSADGTPIFFSYAAHGTFFEEDRNRTSGDWPGKVTQIAPLALIGAIGDVSPKAPGLDKAPGDAKINEFWRLMVSGRYSAPSEPVWAPDLAFTWASEPIRLAKPQPHPTFASTYKIPQSLAVTLATKFAPPSASITAFRLGDLAVVGVPGEPTSHLGRTISEFGRRMGYTAVLVISHVNGWMGYILDPKDYDNGGYEATLSLYGRDEGNQVVAAAERSLYDLIPTDKNATDFPVPFRFGHHAHGGHR